MGGSASNAAGMLVVGVVGTVGHFGLIHAAMIVLCMAYWKEKGARKGSLIMFMDPDLLENPPEEHLYEVGVVKALPYGDDLMKYAGSISRLSME
jgi:hypothetical protein